MPDVDLDRNGLEVLTRRECLTLLSSMPVARIGLSMAALPVILPVNIVCTGDDLIIRTTAGSKLDAALDHAVVAVEADAFDSFGHTGWSVLVRGTSRVLAQRDEIDHARGLALRAWANDEADRFIAVSIDLISGRRLVHGQPFHARLGG